MSSQIKFRTMLTTVGAEDLCNPKEDFYHSIWSSVKRMRTSFQQVKKNVKKLKYRVDVSKEEQDYLNYLDFIRYTYSNKSTPMSLDQTISKTDLGRPKQGIDIYVKRIDYYVGFHDIRPDYSQIETGEAPTPNYPTGHKSSKAFRSSSHKSGATHVSTSLIRKSDTISHRVSSPGKKSQVSPEY